jgi:hypothetical protein
MQKMKLKTPAGHTEIIVGEGLSKELTSLGGELILLVDEQVLAHHRPYFRILQDHFHSFG